MDSARLRDDLIEAALGLGWTAAGVTGVRPFTTARARALDAIEAGRMEGMPWLTADRVRAATDLRERYPWARSLLALAWPYQPVASAAPSPCSGRPRGQMASYACLPGDPRPPDYHDLLAERCDAIVSWLEARVPDVRTKRFVDHGWAMDRAVAARAGIGFTGKNSFVITLSGGSYVLLAELLLSVELPPSSASQRSCGDCHRCLDACPTGAIVAPGTIDARRCISYLTIEHVGRVAEELRPALGTWIFGCDVCQQVCPINDRLASTVRPDGAATTSQGPVPFPDLLECLVLTDEEFAARFRGTAVWRTGRRGLARNAAYALGNVGDDASVEPLREVAASDEDDAVRDAALWAIERISRTTTR